MNLEIERKFLTSSDEYKKLPHKKSYIQQGFLNSDKNRVVRVRLKNNIGFLTIKGKSNESGTTRFEWEKEISKEDAENLLLLCEKSIIKKYRYEIKFANHVFEVDEFLGENKGLTITEIELSNEKETFSKPSWLGREVTNDKKYYNSNLSSYPFSCWK